MTYWKHIVKGAFCENIIERQIVNIMPTHFVSGTVPLEKH